MDRAQRQLHRGLSGGDAHVAAGHEAVVLLAEVQGARAGEAGPDRVDVGAALAVVVGIALEERK